MSREKSLPMKWTLYMKPTPYSERLFQLLNDSNAYLITLSVDSDKTIQTLNNYTYDDLANIINYCKKYKISKHLLESLSLYNHYQKHQLPYFLKISHFHSLNIQMRTYGVTLSISLHFLAE